MMKTSISIAGTVQKGALLCSVVLAGAVPAGAHAQEADDYPAREVLAAFATACSGVEDSAVNMASAEAAGWERLAEDADTPVSALVRQGKVAAAELVEEGELLAGGEFRKQVAGRTLYLSISGMRLDEILSRGCRLYDFDAPRALSAEELQEWSVREPNASEALDGGASKVTFNPGLKPGHMQMEVYFVPAGSDLLPGFSLAGISLVASAIAFES